MPYDPDAVNRAIEVATHGWKPPATPKRALEHDYMADEPLFPDGLRVAWAPLLLVAVWAAVLGWFLVDNGSGEAALALGVVLALVWGIPALARHFRKP
jgi:hypothetical protein